MNLHRPVQRLARSGPSMPVFTTSVRPQVRHVRPLFAQHRTLFGWLRGGRDRKPLDPTADDFLTRKPTKNSLPPAPSQGGLAQGNIFDDGTSKPEGETAGATVPAHLRDPELMKTALDPKPEARKRWERKMVLREIRKGKRINKTTLVARNERQHVLKSHFFKTSLKKLMPLARQIAGKSVEEAIVQMRFSKKKVAKDVLTHLERARDEATVMAGMGLGPVRRRKAAEESGEEVERTQKMLVIDRKGKKHIVSDKTDMYVDQAWIGRGTPDYGLDRRAKGRRYRTDRPFTSITVQLKEEQTRIREQNERADREAAKKPWVNLPDRPVTRQTQYPLW